MQSRKKTGQTNKKNRKDNSRLKVFIKRKSRRRAMRGERPARLLDYSKKVLHRNWTGRATLIGVSSGNREMRGITGFVATDRSVSPGRSVASTWGRGAGLGERREKDGRPTEKKEGRRTPTGHHTDRFDQQNGKNIRALKLSRSQGSQEGGRSVSRCGRDSILKKGVNGD